MAFTEKNLKAMESIMLSAATESLIEKIFLMNKNNVLKYYFIMMG